MSPFISLKSTTVTRSFGVLTLVTPLSVGEALKGKIVSMVHLVVSIIKLSSETWYTIVNGHTDDRMVVYRSGIDEVLDEISHTCLWALETPQCHWHMSLVFWVLWGEIKVDFNDLKHTVHLIGGCYGLGNTNMTCLYDYHQF